MTETFGELSTRNDELATRWRAHNVRHHGNGAKRFHHSIVGEVDPTYELVALVAEPGLTVTISPPNPPPHPTKLSASSCRGPPHHQKCRHDEERSGPS